MVTPRGMTKCMHEKFFYGSSKLRILIISVWRAMNEANRQLHGTVLTFHVWIFINKYTEIPSLSMALAPSLALLGCYSVLRVQIYWKLTGHHFCRQFGECDFSYLNAYKILTTCMHDKSELSARFCGKSIKNWTDIFIKI